MNRIDYNKRSGRSSSFIRRSTRFAIYYRDGFRCQYCKKKYSVRLAPFFLSLDHIVPRAYSGTHKVTNLITACRVCNSSRQDSKLRAPTQARLERQASKVLDREVGRIIDNLLS